MSVDDNFRVTFSGQLCGQFVENVMYMRQITGSQIGVAATKALLAGISSEFAASYLAIIPAVFTGLLYSAELITSPGGPRLFSNDGWGGSNGDRAGGVLDSGNSPVINSAVHLNGKNATGKIFVPGVTALDLLNNVYDGGFVSACNDFCDFLHAPFSGAGSTFQYIVWNKATATGGIPSVSQLSLNPGTQRRRMRPLTG